jgi:hypothetical protein
MIDIDKAFEGRWRIKAESHSEAWIKGVKDLCHDFFTAGILLGEGEHIPPIPMSAIENAAYEIVGFETFWNQYDKKVGRPKCEKLWSKLTLEERKMCLGYIPLYKQAQPEKQYRKNPETFLRNKSWNDEIIFRNGTDKQQQQRDRLAEVANRIAEYTKDAK